jgi:hypothetical protein
MADQLVPISGIKVPASVLFRLEDIAERRGMTLSQYLVQAGLAVAGVAKASAGGADSVRDLHAAGLADKQIAARLGMTNQAVARRRHVLGLKANTTRNIKTKDNK